MNVTERITIASKSHLLSRNLLMLVKETPDRKGFINTTNYNNNIYLDKLFAFAKFFPRRQALVLKRRTMWKIAVCYEKIVDFGITKTGVFTSEIRSWKFNFYHRYFYDIRDCTQKVGKS